MQDRFPVFRVKCFIHDHDKTLHSQTGEPMLHNLRFRSAKITSETRTRLNFNHLKLANHTVLSVHVNLVVFSSYIISFQGTDGAGAEMWRPPGCADPTKFQRRRANSHFQERSSIFPEAHFLEYKNSHKFKN